MGCLALNPSPAPPRPGCAAWTKGLGLSLLICKTQMQSVDWTGSREDPVG